MYFDFRNHGSDRLDGVDRLSTSTVSVDEWLALGDKFRRKDQCADCEILAVPRDHCFSDFGYLNEESVLRPVLLAQFHWHRRRRRRDGCSGCFDPDLAHHECPERWCSSAEGPLSNSSSDALSHSRSAMRR